MENEAQKKGLITQFDEKLPTLEPNLGNEIASLGYITSSNNCVVTVKSYKDDMYSIYIPVKKMEQLHKLKISIKIDKRLMDKSIVTSSENPAAALGDKERINCRTQLFNPIKKACHGDRVIQNEKLRLQTLQTLGLFLKRLLFFDTMSNHTLFLTYTDNFKKMFFYDFFFVFFNDFAMASLV